MHPDDMAGVGITEGDLVEVYNDNGATQAMVYPMPTARRGETFMLFAYPRGERLAGGNLARAPLGSTLPG